VKNMNKKIEELAIYSGMEDNCSVDTLLGADIEKFAMQIIMECISQCRGVGDVAEATTDDERFKNVTKSCERMIKMRFGMTN